MTGKTWQVYKHLAGDDALLYVGCTANLTARNGQHSVTSAWWPQVVAVESVAEFTNREAALAYEAHLIMTLEPEHNTVHQVGPVPSGWYSGGPARDRRRNADARRRLAVVLRHAVRTVPVRYSLTGRPA